MASGNTDPNFIAPRVIQRPPIFHVQSPTPIEAAGIALANVTDDFDRAVKEAV